MSEFQTPRRVQGPVRYAVIGLGHIAQVAVLPAFEHAKSTSKLVALFTGDAEKAEDLGKRYGVPTYSYSEYDRVMASGDVDAVYIALPNHLHCDVAIRAANCGVHVLCEKPMAVTSDECRRMIEAAEAAGVRLMVAYRLHFEQANMSAVEIVRSGTLGEPRLFNSTFTMQVRDDNIRLRRDYGGGPLYDIGIYCINAARYLFQAEPLEVTAFATRGSDKRFREVDESVTALMKFDGDRLASFVCSFGASDVSTYQIVGTKGDLRLDPAYEYAGELQHHLTVDGQTQSRTFQKRDQFAPEIEYFSNCILHERVPEPSGNEGLADLHVIEALHRSLERGGQPVKVESGPVAARPSLDQETKKPAVKKPELVNAESASRS